ncbi:MAG: hypothetical protein NC311_06160 [Muribaculaceae bacterium]|nr:hypothetical protein [Muribaculaceae bacterium]
MAKINRFYLLISMLISYRIGTAMAAPQLNATLFGWMQFVAVADNNADCYICVPVTGYRPSAWESQARSWVATSSNVRIELDNTECGATYNVSAGVKAKASFLDAPEAYMLCTQYGWAPIVPNPNIHPDTCADIDSVCSSYRDSTADSHKLQQYYTTISEDYGEDMTSMEWQVCMFGQSDNICDDGEEPINCGNGIFDGGCKCQNGYYLSQEAADEDHPYGACLQCPSADFWIPIHFNGQYNKGPYASASSPYNNSDDYMTACYIPGSAPYADDTGIFYLTNDCYYGM